MVTKIKYLSVIMKFFYVCALFFLCSFSCLGQSANIKGIVHLLDGTPVKQATVRIQGTSIVSVSDAKGSYFLPDVPYGKQVIRVSSLEIKDKKLNLDVNKPEYDLHIHIDPRGEVSLDEIRVTANSAKRTIETKGFAVNVIETKEAALRNIQTNELLDRTAGVRLRQNAGLGSHVHYNLNGLSGRSVKIMIDGVPASNYGESFSLNSIPPALIERVEVYKGVVPSEIADDALGGVINVVLKKQMDNSLMTSYSTGSFGTHQWNVNGAYIHPKSQFTVRGSGYYNFSKNNYRVWGDKVYVTNPETLAVEKVAGGAKRFHDDYRSYGTKIDFGFVKKKWADQFLLGILYGNMFSENQTGATMEVVYGNRFSKQHSLVYSMQYEKKNLLLEGLDLQVNLNYSDLTRQVIDTSANIFNWLGQISQRGQHLTGAEGGAKTLLFNYEDKISNRSLLSYTKNNHRFIGTFLFDNFKRKPEDELWADYVRQLTDTRKLNKYVAGFTYELSAFNKRLKSNVFYKYYNQSVSLTDPVAVRNPETGRTEYVAKETNNQANDHGYGLALSYALWDKIMVLGSAEKAVRLPSESELLGNESENELSNYGLVPEKSNNYNLGLRLGPFPIQESHYLSLHTNLFVRDVKDMIRRSVQNNIGEYYSYENLENVMSKGFDVELLYRYKQLMVDGNFSLFNARKNNKYDYNGNIDTYYKARLRNEPYMTANLSIAYDLGDVAKALNGTSIRYNYAYVHEFPRDWPMFGQVSLKDMIPVQQAHDIGLLYRLPNNKIILGFDAKNILNAQLFDNWMLQKPGRSFYGKITYILK